jgi:hypothetical protein
MPDFHEIGVGVFIFFSILSLVLIISKPVAKEFETTASTWIRALKNVRDEWRNLTMQRTPEPPPALGQTRSTRKFGSGGP